MGIYDNSGARERSDLACCSAYLVSQLVVNIEVLSPLRVMMRSEFGHLASFLGRRLTMFLRLTIRTVHILVLCASV